MPINYHIFESIQSQLKDNKHNLKKGASYKKRISHTFKLRWTASYL